VAHRSTHRRHLSPDAEGRSGCKRSPGSFRRR